MSTTTRSTHEPSLYVALDDLIRYAYAKMYPHGMIRFDGNYRISCPFRLDHPDIRSQVCRNCKHCVKITDCIDREEDETNAWGEANYVHCDYMLGDNYLNAFE